MKRATKAVPDGGTLRAAAALLDAAVVHHDDEVGQRHGLFLGMGDVDESHAELALPALQLRPHIDVEERIESGERLVEEQRLGLGDERAGQRHALLLATRQLSRRRLAQASIGTSLRSWARLPGGSTLSMPPSSGEHDIVEQVRCGKSGVALEHHRGAALGGRQVVTLSAPITMRPSLTTS